MNPHCILAETVLPCHVCAGRTLLRRSMTHLDGPPTVATDIVPICSQCDEDWTDAVHQSLSDAPTA